MRLNRSCPQGYIFFSWTLQRVIHSLAFSRFQRLPTFLGTWPLSTSLNEQKKIEPFLNHIIILKILRARLQQYVNCELPDVQAGFRKRRGTRDQIANICWITDKARFSRKASISDLLTMPKTLTVWITINCGKF